MSDTIIESVLSGQLNCDLLIKWLNDESIEGAPEDCILYCCNRNEFVAYFLSFLRIQTDAILQTNNSGLQILNQTPDKSLSQRKHHRSISDPTCENDRSSDNLTVKTDRKTDESPNRDKKKPKRRVKTKLFTDENTNNQSLLSNQSSDESRLSIGVERIVLSSTPMKNGFKPDTSFVTSPVTPTSKSFSERCDTPRLSRHSRSQDKSISFGDYLVSATKSSKKKRSSQKNTSNEDVKVDLDLSNSEMFPEIGARKASSLRSERRRINPTNIDKSVGQKSVSLNSFSEAFQQPPLALEDNIAFKPKLQPKETSKNFDAERNILRQERHKLMEKFNILNTNVAPKVTPTIKITQRDTLEKKPSKCSYEEADIAKVVYKEQIDLLIDIYDVLFKNNLILSVNTEIYFLISILLMKQEENDYKLNESQMNDNIEKCILKSIHNSTYFSVKSLWNLRLVLEVILDKNALKTLGENKKVRGFFPDLAKFLLNSYGLKCEADSERRPIQEDRCSNGIVCFNLETDNADNFPSLLSFQNFKKQRDMFYEILRWYQDSQSTGSSTSTLRPRIKSLLASGHSAANHAHLAALCTRVLVECDPPAVQESKLHKLQRRLTCPAAPESHRLPHFTDKEMFYKEFIIHADNESFRVHLKDAIASEIISLDSKPLCSETSNGSDISREFLQLSKKLGTLSKFLGYLTSLPYTQTSDIAIKTGNIGQKDLYNVPKEKVLENNVALRNYSQPNIDIIGLLKSAYENNRLCITLPWIVHYLSMLDYTSLRINYYRQLLKIIFFIYENKLKDLKKITNIFLKSILGWLFDLPHFPRELVHDRIDLDYRTNSDVPFDSMDIIDEVVLFELCPFLRDINVLLSCKVMGEKDVGSFRHITPVNLSLNSEDRMRNKEKEIQSRLEMEFLKSQPSSTRRVLELVVERVTSSSIKELGTSLVNARRRCREMAWRSVQGVKEDRTVLLTNLQQLYTDQLTHLRSLPLNHTSTIRDRVNSALTALLPTTTTTTMTTTTTTTTTVTTSVLQALAVKACTERLVKWTNEHWNSTAILCKDINEELNTLLALGENFQTPVTDKPPPDEFTEFDSPAFTIITLKEQICQLLDDVLPDYTPVLSQCARVTNNNPYCRPPAVRAILQLSVDFVVVFVSKKPEHVTDKLLSMLEVIWNNCCPDRPPQQESEWDGERDLEKSGNESKDDSNLGHFSRILSPRNVTMLGPHGAAWAQLARVLLRLLAGRYLSEGSLTEQCLAVYRQDWPQNTLEQLSACMKSVSAQWRSSTGKFALFLDFLADYCGNMDFDIME
ncbi:codanin-1 [Colias croceus]|uniref:codanin-1 n=1 Tax=Colias crocea TaxID=72248 RepID=UPI001E27EE59|nr:codanin-1 [Colias croceus]XP_045508501.1 codanin-1 [Colias croceus]